MVIVASLAASINPLLISFLLLTNGAFYFPYSFEFNLEEIAKEKLAIELLFSKIGERRRSPAHSPEYNQTVQRVLVLKYLSCVSGKAQIFEKKIEIEILTNFRFENGPRFEAFKREVEPIFRYWFFLENFRAATYARSSFLLLSFLSGLITRVFRKTMNSDSVDVSVSGILENPPVNP